MTDPTRRSSHSADDTAAADAALSANPGYAAGQLARAEDTALSHASPEARARAEARARRWHAVLAGMADGTLTVGSRTPVAGAPAWATLEVVKGGFATGALLAGGDLTAHERALMARLGIDPSAADARARLNGYYLSEPGLAELAAALETGRYRVQLPEEGALLTAAWLLARDDARRAHALLEQLAGHFHRLRFYPVPDARPMTPSAVVRLQTVGETVDELARARVPMAIEKMYESMRYWAPLADRVVALFLETVEGDAPTLQTDASGAHVRRINGGYVIQGGWPCRRYPAGWSERAHALLAEYESTRAQHALCESPESARGNFARLRGYLRTCAARPAALTGRDVGMIRKILASIATARGVPGSATLASRRAAQAHQLAQPTSHQLRVVVRARLSGVARDAGLASLDEVAAAVSAEESARHGVPAGAVIPAHIADKLLRCLEAPIDVLVEKGVIPSTEVLAQVAPQITAQVAAAGITDPELRVLYGAVYAAFRRRRSLLLLNYERQVRLEDLPWVAAIDAQRRGRLGQSESARQTLEQLVTLAVTSFPAVILPNKFLQEVRALVERAGLKVPVTDELASDIFMGQFTEKFVEAGRIAGEMLQGTLYERYYGVSYARVAAMPVPHAVGKRPRLSAEFAALCHERAGSTGGRSFSVAANGKVIEQQQIVTTHNLAPLFAALGLRGTLAARLPELARNVFVWICRALQVETDDWRSKLQTVKNVAYAWRQMVFFLSLVPREELAAFVAWAREYLPEQRYAFEQRFAPALRGLELVAEGGAFDPQGCGATRAGEARRLLGWTTEKHWLLA